MRFILATVATLLICTCVGAQSDSEQDAKLQFFESKIRPVLIKACYECHSNDSDELQGGLLVDSHQGLLVGGDSGPAIVPGSPADSLFMDAIRYGEDSYQMPPSGKLPDAVIADFEQWIADGAVDPRQASANSAAKANDPVELDPERHWAFQPLDRSVVAPQVTSEWPRTDIDRFLWRRMHDNQLSPASDVKPSVLVRRLYFDLIGLPPSADDLGEWTTDWSDQKLAALVDSLLASEDFGRHWGRHWLDVVRYAESSGGGRTLIFPNAWRYRDYIIDAFNSDLPYDQFVIQQIAGDLLPADTEAERRSQLTATGFLALGPTNYELQDKELLRMEVVDEQLDTIGKAMMGLTIGCARCHDHKFDPIPAKDYYAMAGVFRSTKTFTLGNVANFIERSLLSEQQQQAYEAGQQAIAKAKAEKDALQIELQQRQANQINVVAQLDDDQAELHGKWVSSNHTAGFVGDGYRHDGAKQKGEKWARYRLAIPATANGPLFVEMSYTSGSNRSSAVPVLIRYGDVEQTVNVNQTKPPASGSFQRLLPLDAPQAAKEIVVEIRNSDPQGHTIIDAVRLVSDLATDDQQAVWQAELAQLQSDLAAAEQKLAAAERTHNTDVPRAMTVLEEAEPGDWHQHIRGEIRNLGPVVPRGVLTSLATSASTTMPAEQSGRLEFAQWVASPENGLTVRVIVNRIWSHLMGHGIVTTPDNFGAMGQAPSHPELLDYLANQFQQDGWSMKRLIRRIVLSRAYRIGESAQLQQQDSANQFFAYRTARRLTGEEIRDAMLLASGQLQPADGGPSQRPGTKKELGYDFGKDLRRSVYVPWFRNTQLDFIRVFDGPNPNVVTGQRTVSAIPSQALLLMNSPFVAECADTLTQRFHQDNPVADLQALYLNSIGRLPTEEEQSLCLPLWTSDQPSVVSHALLQSVDFLFVK
ncbi:MAG: DUF1553 domain-containing protein [Pirellulaceae bacterium]